MMAVAEPSPALTTADSVVSGVRHAGEILDLFTPQTPECGATGAARQLGISKSHAHRLLSSLACLGLLERQPRTGRYRLGLRSLALASVVLETSALFSGARRIMRVLRERFDVDVAFAVWDRGAVLWLQPDADPSLARRALDECDAVSIVLLAGRSDAEIDAAAQALVVSGASDLGARLEHVRAGGLIGDFRAGEARGCCLVAAPVFGTAGCVVAALSMRAPRARWQIHRHELIRALREAAVSLTDARPLSAGAPGYAARSAYGNSGGIRLEADARLVFESG
jgi:IclR family transcriptional regulator, KDG regulon repressor